MKFSLAVIISCMAVPTVHAIPATKVSIAPAATTSSVPPAQAFALVINDLETLGGLFTKIVSDASSIPRSGIQAIDATHADAEAIHLFFEDANTNLNELPPGSLVSSQTEEILELYSGLVNGILSYLNSVAQNADFFKTLSGTSTITTDLLNSAASCEQFESALITASSTNIQVTSQIIQTFRPVDEARQSALDALSEL
ncbi:hypothetical protein JR316_0008972 [Psilocybe cubensis]|uniref:Uncharacterized protein n=2 Tax=Psilocybe cubensis TaxID=181762 RepID=A0ACB8GSX3_PSICU|nr:hypothetical protein JR316_0008972 [Psilocybe cubensis]KAH9478517.1 hypothetical protein JR316_0008972 [Psilocybe cubensis]